MSDMAGGSAKSFGDTAGGAATLARKCRTTLALLLVHSAMQLERAGRFSASAVNGAAYRTRTCDPIITNDVLYQLS